MAVPLLAEPGRRGIIGWGATSKQRERPLASNVLLAQSLTPAGAYPPRPNLSLPASRKKEPRGDAAAATICGPRSLASGLAAGGDEERGSVSLFNRSPIFVGS